MQSIQRSQFAVGLALAIVGSILFSAKAVIVKLAYRYGVDAATLLALRMAFSLPFFIIALAWSSRGAPLLLRTPLFAPHEKIAEAARRFGVAHVIATPGGDAGLVDGLINWFRDNP